MCTGFLFIHSEANWSDVSAIFAVFLLWLVFQPTLGLEWLLEGWFCTFLKIYSFYYCMCMSVLSDDIYGVPYVCLVPLEFWWEHQILWDGSYSYVVWSWMLGIGLKYSGMLSALKHKGSSPFPKSFHLHILRRNEQNIQKSYF